MDTIQDHLYYSPGRKVRHRERNLPANHGQHVRPAETALPKKDSDPFPRGPGGPGRGDQGRYRTEAGLRGRRRLPVIFIWESGWREVLEQKLPQHFQEEIFKNILTA